MSEVITLYKSAVFHIYAQPIGAADKDLIKRAAQLLGVVRPIIKGYDPAGENAAHWSRAIAGALKYGGAVWVARIGESAPMGVVIVHRDGEGRYAVKACSSMWDEEFTTPKLRAIADEWIAARA